MGLFNLINNYSSSFIIELDSREVRGSDLVLLPYDTAMNMILANCDRALTQTCKFKSPFIQAPCKVSHLGYFPHTLIRSCHILLSTGNTHGHLAIVQIDV